MAMDGLRDLLKNQSSVNELILRDVLALDRTRLANQRTLLAFIRTGMYFVATAIGIIHLDESGKLNWLVWSFVITGITSMLIGLINYFLMRQKINKSY